MTNWIEALADVLSKADLEYSCRSGKGDPKDRFRLQARRVSEFLGEMGIEIKPDPKEVRQ